MCCNFGSLLKMCTTPVAGAPPIKTPFARLEPFLRYAICYPLVRRVAMDYAKFLFV